MIVEGAAQAGTAPRELVGDIFKAEGGARGDRRGGGERVRERPLVISLATSSRRRAGPRRSSRGGRGAAQRVPSRRRTCHATCSPPMLFMGVSGDRLGDCARGMGPPAASHCAAPRPPAKIVAGPAGRRAPIVEAQHSATRAPERVAGPPVAARSPLRGTPAAAADMSRGTYYDGAPIRAGPSVVCLLKHVIKASTSSMRSSVGSRRGRWPSGRRLPPVPQPEHPLCAAVVGADEDLCS